MGPDGKGIAMQPTRSMWSSVVMMAAAVLLVSCSGSTAWFVQNPEPDVDAPTVRLQGTVEYIDVEGGLFVIRGTDGTIYNPINLPESFQSEGKPIEADIRRRVDLLSAEMVGPTIEILRIRERPDSG